MFRKALVILLVLLFSVLNLFAGWTRTFGGTDNDVGYSVQQTTDGGYIISGWTNSYGAGNTDVYLIKTNSNGDTLWTRTYGGSEYDNGLSVQQTTEGGYIIVGYTDSYGAGYNDVYLIKTNSNGDTLWTKTYGGAYPEWGYSVQQTTDGGYIITGMTISYGAGDYDVYLIKTNSNGDTLWTRTYGGPDSDIGRSVQQTTDGGYIIAGFYDQWGVCDVYLIKTNSNGDTLWTKTYGGANEDYGYSVQQTTDGGYIISGWTKSYGAGNTDVYLIKTNSNGITVWTETYGGVNEDRGESVQQTTDGGYIITGYTGLYPNYDVYLIKINSNGDTLWTRTFGGANVDWGFSVEHTTDGGYIIAGSTMSYGVGSDDVYLIKTDENGLVEVEETIISTPERFSYSINQLSNNNVSLQFSLPQNDIVELNIYDAAGRYISTPISGNYPAGVHTVNFKAENSGVYFFNLITNKNSENGKFIVF